MGKLTCLCGETLSNVGDGTTGQMYSDYDMEEVVYGNESCDDVGMQVWECSECGSLAVFRGNEDAKWYRPAFGDYHGLMARYPLSGGTEKIEC